VEEEEEGEGGEGGWGGGGVISSQTQRKEKRIKYKIKKKRKFSHIKVTDQNNCVDYTKYNTMPFSRKPYAYPSPVTWDTEPIFWLHLLFSI
jgi:hypothetical protein